MNDVVRAAFPMALGAAALAPTRRQKVAAWALAALFGASVALQLTRAAYIGALGGICVGLMLWSMRRGDKETSLAVRHSVVRTTIVVCGVFVAIAFLGAPRLLSVLGQRASSLLTEFARGTGTAGYRVTLFKDMLRMVGSKWAFGLGFLHPGAHYVASLPDGSIRNPDMGFLNGLMTMGAIGVVLISLPVLIVLFSVSRRTEAPIQHNWLRLGIAIWGASTLIGSPTLVDLYSAAGLELASAVIAIGVAMTVVPPPDPAPTDTVHDATSLA
jgi:hypothetical protein